MLMKKQSIHKPLNLWNEWVNIIVRRSLGRQQQHEDSTKKYAAVKATRHVFDLVSERALQNKAKGNTLVTAAGDRALGLSAGPLHSGLKNALTAHNGAVGSDQGSIGLQAWWTRIKKQGTAPDGPRSGQSSGAALVLDFCDFERDTFFLGLGQAAACRNDQTVSGLFVKVQLLVAGGEVMARPALGVLGVFLQQTLALSRFQCRSNQSPGAAWPGLESFFAPWQRDGPACPFLDPAFPAHGGSGQAAHRHRARATHRPERI